LTSVTQKSISEVDRHPNKKNFSLSNRGMLRAVFVCTLAVSTAGFSISGPSITRAVASSASVAPLRASLAAPSRRAVNSAVNMAGGATMELQGIEKAKQSAGYKSVDDHVTSGMVVGLGTGSTAYFAVERVGQK